MEPTAAALGTAGLAAAALALGWWLPGAWLVRRLGLGGDGLERFALAWCVGRAGFAGVSLVAASTVGARFVPLLAAVAGAAAAVAWARSRRAPLPGGRGLPADARAPLAAAVAAAALLAILVVARGGLPGADGGLVFQGRDAVNDPLVYAGIARQLHETGWPLTYPLASGATTTSSYLPYGVWVGLHAFGVPMLDVVLRVTPVAEAAALALTAVALVRRLGGPPLAAGLGGVLVVLGGGVAGWLVAGARALGASASHLHTWAFFGPYLLAFNPLAPALQTAFALLLLLAARPGRREAVVAGLLVASLFETKLFVFAPVAAALGVVAFVRPPPGAAPVLRRAAVTAALAALPFVAEKLAWARALGGREATAFVPCPGCVARYLVDGTFRGGDLGFARFADAALDPGAWAGGALALGAVAALGLGVRLVALPALWRGARDVGDEGRAVAHRLAGAAVAASLGAFALVTTRPHFLNGAQFAAVACALLWPFAAAPLASFLVRGRGLGAIALLLALAPGAWLWAVDLGAAARPLRVVPEASLALARATREFVEPGGVVIEPSLLEDTDFPSPLVWHAGRSVYLTLLSSAHLLPEAELYERHDRLATIFTTRDRVAGDDAVAATGAGWLLAPRAWPLRFDPGDALEPVLEHPGGTLYRVRAR